jgi:hypothetical protein
MVLPPSNYFRRRRIRQEKDLDEVIKQDTPQVQDTSSYKPPVKEQKTETEYQETR